MTQTMVLAELYRRHRHQLMKRALRQVGDRAAAEDAVQEAVTDFLEKVDPNEIDNIEAYLGRMVDNSVKTRFRRTGREISHDVLPEEAVDSDLGADLEHADRVRIIQESLGTLKPRQRKALLLDSEGLSVTEIADEIGLTPHNCSALLHRARANLRRQALKQGLLPGVAITALGRARVRLRNTGALLDRLAQIGEAGFVQTILAAAVVIVPLAYSPQQSQYDQARTSSGSQTVLSVSSGPGALEGSSRGWREPRFSHRPGPGPVHVETNGVAADLGTPEPKEGPEPGTTDQIKAWLNDPSSIVLPGCEGNGCPPTQPK